MAIVSSSHRVADFAPRRPPPAAGCDDESILRLDANAAAALLQPFHFRSVADFQTRPLAGREKSVSEAMRIDLATVMGTEPVRCR